MEMGVCELPDVMAFVMVTTGVITFWYLLWAGPAPYGRHKRRAYTIEVPNRVAWLTQECSSFLIPLILYFAQTGSSKILPLAMFLLHYGYRSFLYPLYLQHGKSTPGLVWLAAVAFVAFNGIMQGLQHATCGVPATTAWRGLTGGLIWFVGLAINIVSDVKLQHLCRAKPAAGYQIPHGGLYELISCPNYFGETVEWVGYAIASNTWAAFAFAAFTFANLAPRAQHHHSWYRQRFPEYPSLRKAYIPYVW